MSRRSPGITPSASWCWPVRPLASTFSTVGSKSVSYTHLDVYKRQVIRDIVCFSPLILTLPRFFGIEGILFAAPAADSIAMLVTVILTATYMKTLKEEP